MRKNKNYWTKEKSFEVALIFNNKRDFKKAHVAAYELLRIHGWLDKACSHMKRPENLNKKWTFENCKKEALMYEYFNDFRKNVGRAYIIAKNNNWLNSICGHMKKYERPIKWTFKKCYDEALKYKNRIDFNKNSPNLYNACVRNGWLNDVCKHMNVPYTNQFKWSKEKCAGIALKYKSRKEFSIGDYNAYSSARYNGWLDDICKHMIRLGDRKHKCIYSYEFPDNYVYVGLTYNINVRDKSRRYEKKDAVMQYVSKTKLTPILKQLTDYVPVNIAIILEGEYLQKYVNDGWIALNRTKTGGIGGYNSVWNYNRIKKIILEYNNLNEFMKNDIYLFEIAKNRKWLHSLFPNEI